MADRQTTDGRTDRRTKSVTTNTALCIASYADALYKLQNTSSKQVEDDAVFKTSALDENVNKITVHINRILSSICQQHDKHYMFVLNETKII